MPEARGWARLLAVVLLPALLAACAPGPRVWAPDDVVSRALHPNGGDHKIALVTVVNNRTGAGDHSSVVIGASHRVLYDPAGTWFHRRAPQRNDVHYGFSPELEQIYLGYHARDTHHVVIQTLPVTAEQAAAALRTAEAQGRAGIGTCAIRTGALLRSVPGLQGLSTSPFPRRLQESFAQVPGVETRRVFEADVPDWARTRIMPEDGAAPALQPG